MCQMNYEEKLKAAPAILSSDALITYSSNTAGCASYNYTVTSLKKCHDNSVKQARNLTEGNSLGLIETLGTNPDASEIEVFRKPVAKLMCCQK